MAGYNWAECKACRAEELSISDFDTKLTCKSCGVVKDLHVYFVDAIVTGNPLREPYETAIYCPLVTSAEEARIFAREELDKNEFTRGGYELLRVWDAVGTGITSRAVIVE